MNNPSFPGDPFERNDPYQRLGSGELLPVWRDEDEVECYSPLSESIQVDVVVVGGGITGVTAALDLAKRGMRVALLEARTIGAGVTGRSSAHLTAMLDARLHTIRSRFDDEAAQRAWRAGAEAIGIIESNARTFEKDCGFGYVDGWLYSENEEGMDEVRKEEMALRELGIPVELSYEVPLPYSTVGALRVPQQAIFHPLLYIEQLAQAAARAGCKIYEHTRAVDIESEDERVTVKCEHGTVTADRVIVATHVPVLRRFALTQSEAHPCRSYMLALSIRNIDQVPNALFWDTEQPYHYIRRFEGGSEGPLLLVGGADHRTGAEEHPWARLDDLERFYRERFDVAQVVRRWSAQVYQPADGLPYIGKAPFAENIYVATGYDGNGLTLGTISATAIAREIAGEESEYLELFNARRVKLMATVGHVVSEGVKIVGGFLGDLFSPDTDKPVDLDRGEGRTVKIEGDHVGIYRDYDGTVHALSADCTHVGCTVQWNPVEQSWDCPCHGGRYDRYGCVIEGPPTRNLTCLESIHPERMLKSGQATGNPESSTGTGAMPEPAT